MQKQFRIHSQAAPEFHHFDIPGHVISHPAFDIAKLMREQNYILIRNGNVHCRITYCAQYKNFKIIRPDRISNQMWQEIKKQGQRQVQEYIDWYSTPPPTSMPPVLRQNFLYDFTSVLEEGEERAFHCPIEAEHYQKWLQIEKKTQSHIDMLEAYFDAFPSMRYHPMIYTMLCGRMTPTMRDLDVIIHFRSIIDSKGINNLYNAVLQTTYSYEFFQQLFKFGIYPVLTDVEGHLTFEIPAIFARNRNKTAELLLHDLNIDLLVLNAFLKEANFLQRHNPGAEHMIHTLPPTIYKIFNMHDRIQQLSRSELWHTYHFLRVSCNGVNQLQHQNIPRRTVLSFSICNGCLVYCARESVHFNWAAQYNTIPLMRTSKPFDNRSIVKRQLSQSPPPRQKRMRIAFTDTPNGSNDVQEQPEKNIDNTKEQTTEHHVPAVPQKSDDVKDFRSVDEELDYESEFI